MPCIPVTNFCSEGKVMLLATEYGSLSSFAMF